MRIKVNSGEGLLVALGLLAIVLSLVVTGADAALRISLGGAAVVIGVWIASTRWYNRGGRS